MRAGRSDLGRWSDLLNDTSYTYENLLPYFKKTEKFSQRNPHLPADWEYHGQKGNLHMVQTDISTDLERAIINGNQELGYQFIDHNGRQKLGVSVTQYYIKNGRRDDPGLAFISSAKYRKNLKVLDNSYVVKLDINNETNRVNGVMFTRFNKTYIAKTRKEVILSAGAIGSPQILLLSGIGPEDHLQSLEIPVVQNLPVGQSFRDKIYGTMVFSSNTTSWNPVTEQSVRDFLKGRGQLTSGIFLNTLTWFQLPSGATSVELMYQGSTSPDSPETFAIAFQINTHSVGSIRLNSSDPFQYPLIDTNYLDDYRDSDLLYEASQVVLDLIETEAFRRLNATVILTPPEECNDLVPNSREFWICNLRSSILVGNQLIGTCLTGTNSQSGVVDKDLKVFGIKNLRVADASVIPFPLSDHLTSTCAVIAEKISGEIKIEYKHFY